MPAGSNQHSARRRLGVPADAAWSILTSQAGARIWLADESHPGIRTGAHLPLLGSRSAEIATVGPGTEMELMFASGRRALLQIRAFGAGCEIVVADFGVDGLEADALAPAWQALLTQADFLVDQVKLSRRSCQAMVVINGVSGRRPLTATRGIVDALIAHSDRYSKPDTLSSSYELRRYQMERTRTRPRTDLFELYWADKVPGTKFGDVMSWLRPLAFRRPRDVSDRLRPVAYLVRAVAAASIAAAILLLAEIGKNGIDHLWHAANGLAQLAWVTTGISLLGGAVSGFLIASLGDAARYLDPAPGNIAVRQAIRQSGIDLLRHLHDEGQYDRIVIAGNALGSVIGYDIIRLYWTRVHKSHSAPSSVKQSQLDSFEEILARQPAMTGPVPTARLDEYRKAQRNLWREYRRLGLPWLVTDLVTIGSPLTHAGTLLARSPADLDELVKDRELPTCPPSVERDGLAQKVTYLAAGQMRTLKMLTFDAPFALTRWTNIYAPCKGVAFGDPIGGPLAPVLGTGIKDIPIRISPWWRRRTPLAHTSYWRRASHDNPSPAIRAISESLGIDSSSWLNAHITEMPWEASISTHRTDEPV